MNRFAWLGAFAVASVCLAQDKPRLTVVPFAALGAEIPPRAGLKAQAMLLQELKSAEAFVVLEPARRLTADPASTQLAEARGAVEAAKELRAKHKFRLADEALQRALSAYRAAAASLTDVSELADAWALAAAVAYSTGRDDDGARSLAQALALAPDRELPLARTSPLFSAVVAEARRAVKAAAHGSLLLESAPSNAPVTLDGIAAGSTPLSVRDVPPGLHAWSVQLPTGELAGGLVDVQPGKPASVRGQAANGKDAQAHLLVSLAQNRLDPELLAAARDAAKAAGADLVIFGALSRDDKGLALDSFFFTAATGALRRLTRAHLDPELLSAGVQFFALAGELSERGSAAGEPVKVPASVSTGLLATSSQVTEVKYGAELGKDPTLELIDAESKDAPAEPRHRVPLKARGK
jgi:tetratricopeptide (TPR) repeat protein